MRTVATSVPVAWCATLSIMRLCCAKAGERIEILFRMEKPEDPRHIVLDVGPDPLTLTLTLTLAPCCICNIDYARHNAGNTNFWCKFLVPEHQIEHVLFCARNLHEKNLALSRCDRHPSFLYLCHQPYIAAMLYLEAISSLLCRWFGYFYLLLLVIF